MQTASWAFALRVGLSRFHADRVVLAAGMLAERCAAWLADREARSAFDGEGF